MFGIKTLREDDSAFLSLRKGEESIRGELTKNGFKKVQVLTARGGYFDCTGKISEDGNKIIIDDGQVIRVTLNRK